MLNFNIYKTLVEIRNSLFKIKQHNLGLWEEFEKVIPIYVNIDDDKQFLLLIDNAYTIQEKAIMTIITIKYKELLKDKDINYIASICEFLANNNINSSYFYDFVHFFCNDKIYNNIMLLFNSNFCINKITIVFDLLYQLYDITDTSNLDYIIDFLAKLNKKINIIFNYTFDLLDIYNKILAKMEEIDNKEAVFSAIDYQILHELFKINSLNNDLSKKLLQKLREIDYNISDDVLKIKSCLDAISNYNVIPFELKRK